MGISLFAQPPIKKIQKKWFKFDHYQNKKIEYFKEYLGLKSKDGLIEYATNNIKGKKTHIKYAQKFENISIWGGILVSHWKDGVIHSVNGNIISNLSINTSPSLTKNNARNIALEYINAKHYAWDSPRLEKILQKISKDQDASFFPQGELFIHSPDFKTETARLTYMFEIFALKPALQRVRVFVDAHTGEIISQSNLIHCGSMKGFGMTRYNSMQKIGIDTIADEYVLETDSVITNTGISPPLSFPLPEFLGLADLIPSPIGIPCKNDNPNFGYSDPAAVSVHWASEKALEYIRFVGLEMNILWEMNQIINVVHYGDNMSNAFYNGVWFSYGDGKNGVHPWVSLDLVSHEIAHAIIQSTANLVYEGESGALNESFADIFAVMSERHTLGPDNWNLIIGEDILDDNMIYRNFRDLMIYKGEGWYFGNDDHGGVHTNSGVQNHWFYLLSKEITIDSAALICFYSLTNYLTPYSDYQDARAASIEAAKEIFGDESDEALAVCNAWNEVGVYGDEDNLGIDLTCSINNNYAINESIQIESLSSDTLVINNDVEIHYTSTGIDSVDLFVKKNNLEWECVQSLVPSTETLIWTIPDSLEGDSICLKVSNSKNAFVLDTTDYYVVGTCPANAVFSLDTNVVCVGNSINFYLDTVNLSSTDSIVWNINESSTNISSSVDSVEYTFDTIGNHTISCIVYSNGCYSSFSRQVFVADTSVSFIIEETGNNSVIFHVPNFDTSAVYTLFFGDGDSLVLESNQVFHEYDLSEKENGIYTSEIVMENQCDTFYSMGRVVFLNPINTGGRAESCDEIWSWMNPTDSMNFRTFYYDPVNNPDTIYGGTQGNGTHIINTSDVLKNTLFNANETTPDPLEINAIYKTSGNIFQGTYNGLTKNGVGVDGLLNDTIWAIAVIGDIIFIGTNNKLIQYSISNDSILNSFNFGIPVKTLAVKGSLVYIGTFGSGIYLLDSDVAADPMQLSLVNENIRTLAVSESDLWLGTKNDGVIRIGLNADGTINQNDTTDTIPVPNNSIWDIMIDHQGFVWAATNNRLVRYDTITKKSEYFTPSANYLTPPANLPNNKIRTIEQDVNGNIWIGTTNGLAVFFVSSLAYFYEDISCAGDVSRFINRSHLPSYNNPSLPNYREWRVDNELVSTDMDLSYVFEEPGTYVITLINGNDNCGIQAYKDTVVIPPSIDEIKKTVPQSVGYCTNGTNNIHLEEDDFTTYTWRIIVDGDTTVISESSSCPISSDDTIFLEVKDFCNNILKDTILVENGDYCVLPGDTNGDGVVNGKDVLILGLLYGRTTTKRSTTNTNFHPQSIEFEELGEERKDTLAARELANADCNGDGIIDELDMAVINKNFGKFIPGFSYTPTIPHINASYILVPKLEGIDPITNELIISVSLMSKDGFDIIFYGLTFVLEYDVPSLAISNQPQPLFIKPILPSSNSLSLHRKAPSFAEILESGGIPELEESPEFKATATAYVGTDKFNRIIEVNLESEDSPIGYVSFSFAIGDELNLPGGGSNRYLTISPRDMLMVNSFGETIPIKGQEIDIYLPDDNYKYAITTDFPICSHKGKIVIHHLEPKDSSITYTYTLSYGEESITTNTETIEVDLMDNDTVMIKIEDEETILWEDSIVLDPINNDFEVSIIEEEHKLRAISNYENVTYIWHTGEISESIEPDTSGNYFVIATDTNGCTSTGNKNYRKGDSEASEDYSQIYPTMLHPFNGNLNIAYHSKKTEDSDIMISDISGKVFWKETMKMRRGDTKKSIYVGHLPQGIYILVIKKGNEFQSHKFTVMKL